MGIKDFSKEVVSGLINESYLVACNHGFHDEKKSVDHWIMLVISEVGEVINADREGRDADLVAYESMCKHDYETNAFLRYVKDSVEDELADVCIRLYDLCGTLGIMPVHHSSEAMQDMFGDFVDILGSYSLTERCKVLCELLCQCNNDMELEETDDYEGSETISFWIGAALCLVYCMAQDMGIDLLNHIRLKMRYNESRQRLHGKKY